MPRPALLPDPRGSTWAAERAEPGGLVACPGPPAPSPAGSDTHRGGSSRAWTAQRQPGSAGRKRRSHGPRCCLSTSLPCCHGLRCCLCCAAQRSDLLPLTVGICFNPLLPPAQESKRPAPSRRQPGPFLSETLLTRSVFPTELRPEPGGSSSLTAASGWALLLPVSRKQGPWLRLLEAEELETTSVPRGSLYRVPWPAQSPPRTEQQQSEAKRQGCFRSCRA